MPTSIAALIHRQAQYFLVKRKPGGDLSGKWELPGGKVDEGETPEEAVVREIEEELGIACRVGDLIGEGEFVHHGKTFQLKGYSVQADPQGAVLREHVDSRWCTLSEAMDLDLAQSDRSLLETIQRNRLKS